MSKGYTVLSVIEKPLDSFDFNWLIPQIVEHKPQIIEMTRAQNRRLHYAGYKYIRGIPIRIVDDDL